MSVSVPDFNKIVRSAAGGGFYPQWQGGEGREKSEQKNFFVLALPDRRKFKKLRELPVLLASRIDIFSSEKRIV